MLKQHIIALTFCAIGTLGFNTASYAQAVAQNAQSTPPQITQISPMMTDIAQLQKTWAQIKYQTPEEDRQSKAFTKLLTFAEQVTQTHPNSPEPKIWQGIILSTKAGIDGGLGALKQVKKAKSLFEAALKQNPQALSGSAHTSLGSLYYQVPGWPIGFGDDKKAEKHLKQALTYNPTGIDPNYFYADFLIENKRSSEAVSYLTTALKAPTRPNRPLADAGRMQEIKALLAKIDKTVKNTPKSHNN